MAVKTLCPAVRPKEQDVWLTRRETEEEEECLRQFPYCPACSRDDNTTLILPCSHLMCSGCVAAGEEAESCLLRPNCTLLCPCCRGPVELPCWSWSSAVLCLPKHPCLKSDGDSEMKISVGSSHQGHHVQGMTSKKTAPSALYCSITASSSVPPLDGAVDLEEEEMEQSVYGLRFVLDPSTAHPSLHLSNSSLIVTYQEKTPTSSSPENRTRDLSLTPDPEALPTVCANVGLERGQYYWEVDVCNSSNYRIGVMSGDESSGWWLHRHNSSFFVVYDGRCEPLLNVPPHIKTLGVFLNIGGGTLGFYNPLSQEHLATLATRFSPAVLLPSVSLGQGRLRMRCGLPPPPHVFCSKDSTYRGNFCWRRGRWRREVSFQSVRKVIKKFEGLSGSDSVSGATYREDVKIHQTSEQAGQEAGTE